VRLDVIGLATLNEARGHVAGDAHLKAVGAGLAAAAGRGTCYRLNGDEFAALVPDATAWQALQLVGGTPGLRAGAADGGTEISPAELDRRADLALLAARRERRAAVVYAADLELGGHDEAPRTDGLRALTSALAQAVDAKDAYTRSHCETVSTVASLIAQELGLDPRHVAQVRLAGLLHDVGKIGIPDAILNKPVKLDAAEWQVMRSHTRLGHDILAAAGLEDEAGWVLHHHERVDGPGYPDGLAGGEVPLESRIILRADTFEAITSDRSYWAGRSEEEALAELHRHAGGQFDPACVAALEAVLATRGHRLPALAA
jgi:putative nucleotidyltransferase with HDIG domain